ncbi:cytidine deaminase [Rhodotorula paludigena]|uniref:cytidine deaminase n=1 Tax=Rhodotorula paludigena TaxID=86838 RepID=UPI0031716E57
MVPFPALPLAPSDRTRLISLALSAREGSYSPYSKFRVGACLLTDGGEFVQGCNVECASYGGAICAERTAVVKAVSTGTRKFVALAVTSDVDGMVSPCGICRQVLREFCPLEMPVLLIPASYEEGKTPVKNAAEAEGNETSGVVVETTMGELLPLSFGPSDLEKPRTGPNAGAVAGAEAAA